MRGLGALLQLADSALPTGAFSHSFGLESSLDSGAVTGEAELLDWLRLYLDTQLTVTDAVAIRRTCRADEAGVEALDAELGALLVPRQIREASTRMGRRLLEIAADSFSAPPVARYAEAVQAGRCGGHYAIVFALAGSGQGYDEDVLVEAYLHSALAALVANAVRAIPLGQLAGQRVVTALRESVPEAAVRSRSVDDLGFGAAAAALEIHQMRHEHLHARMFAS